VALILVHLPTVPDQGATRLLHTVALTRSPCPLVVLTDTYREQQALTLLRAGAADYLELPADVVKLTHLVQALARRLQSDSGLAQPAEPSADLGESEDGLGGLMGQVRRVAPQEITLLLASETGTGKTRLARLVHDLSPRRDQPFLVVDCGALSANLIESELFGHTKGAFTGADRERPGKLAAAGRGTLLLDEINSLPLPLQSKLLRAVEERVFEPVGSNTLQPVRARLIAASNASLESEVAAGRFREDLYYRLNVVAFFLPPLRDRRAAIPSLAQTFLEEFAGRNRPDVVGYRRKVLKALQGYDWPGNVRELRNVVERAVALCAGPTVELQDLPETVRNGEACLSGPAAVSFEPLRRAGNSTLSLSQCKEEAEIRCIRDALQKHRNNRLRAAAELGISRMGLYKKLHKYGLMDGVADD